MTYGYIPSFQPYIVSQKFQEVGATESELQDLGW